MLGIKSYKTIIIGLILIVLIGATLYYIFVMQNETEKNNGDRVGSNKIFFSISFEKYVFSLCESINVTFRIYNNNNETIKVSEYWMGGTLYLHLWNSTGHEIIMNFYSVPGFNIEEIVLGPGEIYEECYDIKPHFGMYKNENNTYSIDDRFYFIEDYYSFNTTYVNFHPYEENFNWSNGIQYHSNTIEFQIE